MPRRSKRVISGKDELKLNDNSIFINGFYGNRYLSDLSFWISGLTSLNVWYHPKYNKLIYVLGESHTYNNLCEGLHGNVLPADEFFMLLLNSSLGNRLINKDVFMESLYNPILVGSNRFEFRGFRDGYMGKVFAKLVLEGCTSTTTDACRYYKEHTRFHSSDVRSISVPIIDYIMMIRVLKDYDFNDPIAMRSLFTAFIVRYSDKKYDMFNVFSQEIKNALVVTKVMKQIQNIDPKYNEVKNFFIRLIDDVIEQQFKLFNSWEFAKLMNEYNNYTLLGRPITREDFNTRHPLLRESLKLDLMFMDFYTLARLFRKFSHTSKSSGGINDNKGKANQFTAEPRNIIIYAGEAHCEFYNRIFGVMDFENINHSHMINSKFCIKLDRLNIKWICNDLQQCIMPLRPLRFWTVKDVLLWIENTRDNISTVIDTIDQIKIIITRYRIDGTKLMNIKDSQELRDIGVVFGPSIKLFNAIQRLK